MPDTSPKKRFRRPRLKHLLIAGAVVLTCVVGWRLWVAHASTPAIGIYMTGDGESFLDIRRAWHGGLRVADGRVELVATGLNAHTIARLGWRDGQLLICSETTQQWFKDEPASAYRCDLVLEPSATRKGDWDIRSSKLVSGRPRRLSDVVGNDWSRWIDAVGLADVIQSLVSAFAKDADKRTTPESALPVVSYLSRVDDARLGEYVHERHANGDTARSLELALALADDHPDIPLLGLHAVEQLARSDQPEKARRRWELWRARSGQPTEPLLKRVARGAYSNLAMCEYRRDYLGIEHYEDVGVVEDDYVDLHRFRSWMRSVFEADQLMASQKPLIGLDVKGDDEDWSQGNMWAMVSLMRTEGVRALLEQFRGRDHEAFEDVAAYYWLGLSTGDDRGLVRSSTSLRRNAVRVLTPIALNACETAEEAAANWDVLQRLHVAASQSDGPRLTDREAAVLWGRLYLANSPWAGEVSLAVGTSDMAFDVLRVGMAIREFALANGRLPTTPGELTRRFPDGLPIDVFHSTTAPLRMVTGDGFCRVYSFGPDFDDDGGVEGGGMEYYPGWGRGVEGGDIVLRVPLDREFPFSSESAGADNAAELLSRFPNGFPDDVYANFGAKRRQLGVYDSTTTQPVIVFSQGDDSRASWYTEYLVPDPSDPVTSPSEPYVFEHAPRAQEKIVTDWALYCYASRTHLRDFGGSGRSSSETLALIEALPKGGVFDTEPSPSWNAPLVQPSTPTPPPGRYRSFGPPYDPTNGVYSLGDIFVEIPRRSTASNTKGTSAP